MNDNIPFLDRFSANDTLPILKDVLTNIVFKGVFEHLIKQSLKCDPKLQNICFENTFKV